MPHVLQPRTIDLAHVSHVGITKIKALMREKIGSTEMPERPWDTLHMDFYGPLPSGEYLLVVIDRYSRFPEVELLRSIEASSVIPKLDRIFAIHGIPGIIKTDTSQWRGIW